MSDYRVPVKAWLKGPVYNRLEAVARHKGVPDVGTLLADLAERSVTPRGTRPAPRTWHRITPEIHQAIAELRTQDWSERRIANRLGISKAAVHRSINGGRR